MFRYVSQQADFAMTAERTARKDTVHRGLFIPLFAAGHIESETSHL